MVKSFFFSLLLCTTLSFAQEVNIIPQPVKVVRNTGNFVITSQTSLIVTNKEDNATAAFLNGYLSNYYGFVLPVTKKASKNYIKLTSKTNIDGLKSEGYTLKSDKNGVEITGNAAIGTFYGMQTLIQLLPVEKSKSLAIAAVEVQDEPRFAYRGAMLDVGRHYFPVAFVKKYIDYLALHKMNYFHWHLTEDQGWRIEIKKYPKLTEIGSKRNGSIIGSYPGKGSDNTPEGGFYTQEEVKDIVKYASDRFITVIPEIEMPGHGGAAIAAYPELSCFPNEKTKLPDTMISAKSKEEMANGRNKIVQETWGVHSDVYVPSEYTFKFLQDVIDEVVLLFPSKYIHVGGDEAPKDAWKRSEFCQQLIKEKGLKDEHGLQSYFIQRMEKYINGKGRTLIGWDEILEGGLAPNAVVMSWRGEEGGIAAAKENHQVIMTPGSHVYLDHSQTKNEKEVTIGGYLPIETVYSYEPIPKELNEQQAKYVLGAQGNVWTEYMANPAKVEYMIFPRLSALSEVLWSSKENKNWSGFQTKIETMKKRYTIWGANYYKE
ncbi:hexosaminidase [Flavobacterium aquidurense]|uniref:beta-N-acetylhexosaminidase n=1 Tax=Flavobacterium frigidimaris TaxID=262320 RepID=A0ABX4BKV9_FLAFR|nr:beta-N-acetylhexosaminidase [Flavobacterium frigidimaris]OXA75706.1 beta-N-acetylhexosaminidase [Flavobacterium frigidimaris]SDZ65873.1 hexosaminidase [Flavobacterium aquidurense]